MAFDKIERDPDEIQKIQINETIRFIQEQEKILPKFDKSLDFLYDIMANYHPPDEGLKPFYDRYLVIQAMWKSLLADVKVYNAKNYTDYAGLDNTEESF